MTKLDELPAETFVVCLRCGGQKMEANPERQGPDIRCANCFAAIGWRVGTDNLDLIAGAGFDLMPLLRAGKLTTTGVGGVQTYAWGNRAKRIGVSNDRREADAPNNSHNIELNAKERIDKARSSVVKMLTFLTKMLNSVVDAGGTLSIHFKLPSERCGIDPDPNGGAGYVRRRNTGDLLATIVAHTRQPGPVDDGDFVFIDVRGCPRCGSAHPGLAFWPFTCSQPRDPDNPDKPYTHYAPCPATGEPVLMTTDATTGPLAAINETKPPERAANDGSHRTIGIDPAAKTG